MGVGAQGLDQDLQQGQDAGHLRPGGDPGRHRRRGPLVNIRCPLVERHGGHLEPESDQDQEHRDRAGEVAAQAGVAPPVEQGPADPRQPGRPGQAVEQAQAEEEQSRRDRPVDEVFQARLGRPRPPLLEGRQQVEADRHHLQAQEERQQLLRGHQEHHPHARPERQGEVFAPVLGERPGGRERHHQSEQDARQRVQPLDQRPAAIVPRNSEGSQVAPPRTARERRQPTPISASRTPTRLISPRTCARRPPRPAGGPRSRPPAPAIPRASGPPRGPGGSGRGSGARGTGRGIVEALLQGFGQFWRPSNWSTSAAAGRR